MVTGLVPSGPLLLLLLSRSAAERQNCWRASAFGVSTGRKRTATVLPVRNFAFVEPTVTASAVWNSTNEWEKSESIELNPEHWLGFGSALESESFQNEFLQVKEEKEASKESDDTYKQDDGRHDGIVKVVVNQFLGKNNSSDESGNDGAGGRDGNHNSDNGNSGNYRRVNVQLPPGWGKTPLAQLVLADESLKVDTAVFVTPYRKLVEQFLFHLDQFGFLKDIPHSRLIVASQTNRTEMHSTEADEIANFLVSSEHKGKLRLLISTYRSLPRVAEALKLLKEEGKGTSIGLGIFDEAHEMEGASTKISGLGLCDDLLPIDYRLFQTATPQNYTKSPKVMSVLGSKLRDDGSSRLIVTPRGHSDVGVNSFADESLFGPCVAKRTFRESTEQNITVPLTLCAMDKMEMQSLLGVTFNDGVTREGMLPFALQAAFHKLNVSHAISFHSRNSRSRDFVQSTKDLFGDVITAVTIDGKMPPSKREELLSIAKKAPVSVVSNCRVLATGVDEADWDLAVMADPVTSPILTHQRIGRVSRVAPNKKRGYVFVPVFIDADGTDDMQTALSEDSVGYQMICSIFQAMVDDDLVLKRDVLYIVEESRRIGRPLPNSDYPESVQDAFMLPPSMPLEMKHRLMDRLIVKVGGAGYWKRMYDILLAYKDREGHCNAPQSHEEEGENLGNWLVRQRHNKRKGLLDECRVKLLEDAGVVWDRHDEKWQQMYELLLAYKNRKGHCNVQFDHNEEGQNIGWWLDNQRHNKKKGLLDEYRVKLLENAGVTWNPRDEKWQQMYELLLAYKDCKGHCNVPSGHEEEGSNLGDWLVKQRQNKKKGLLGSTREKLLEDAGIVWSPRDEKWQQMYNLLLAYKNRKGHCNVPRGHEEQGKKLGVWLDTQRKTKKTGRLGRNREQLLDEAGVTWSFQ